MKYLKSWLQDYIAEALPKDEVIVETLNKKAFEVEEVITYGGDTVFDIKVLPNRAHDALGHRGMARELCADFGYTFKEDSRVLKDAPLMDDSISSPSVAIDDAKACTRFMSMRIDTIVVGESPEWLKKRLESIGQRSINNIVDITNYVQFALNKPMHAYDARSVEGTLRARVAKSGEILTTLDDKELSLDGETLVIADDKKVLGLAGIKGGKFSGIQSDTTSVILESANFEPTRIRKTAQRYGMKTDASKRFENGIANSLVEEGLYMTANLIKEISIDAKGSNETDIYPKKDTGYHVGISRNEVNNILGTSYADAEIKATLTRLSCIYETIIPEEYMKETYPKLVGATYKYFTSMREDAPYAFSCSSLISYLYKGIWMPSLSVDKYVFAQKINKEQLAFGDCIFTFTSEEKNRTVGKMRFESVEFLRGTKVPEGVDHLGMYIGDNKIIHATETKGSVVVETLDEFMAGRTIVGYGRMSENLNEERYIVTVPQERLDIRIKEDVAEEIGRIIGYEKLVPVLPQLSGSGLVHKRMYYENKIREILLKNGFSEVMTYTFGNEGEVELIQGLADDKEKLRTSLGKGIMSSLSLNLYNAPLLGQKTIKIFEIGNVFLHDKETRHVALALDDGAKKSNFSESADMILAEIKRTLGVASIGCQTILAKPYVIELDFDTLIETLPEPALYEASPFASLPVVNYKTISSYPFITRDIAMWVPDSSTWESVHTLCSEVRNPLVTRIDLFDTFSKDFKEINTTSPEGFAVQRKTSFAFRLVFQSHEKTLTDDEVNSMMEPYYELFKNKGYEIR